MATQDDEQTITVNAPLEAAEAGWVKWCASGHAKLGKDYAVRFEPASEAQTTHVYLSGGVSTTAARDELARFKQQLEKI